MGNITISILQGIGLSNKEFRVLIVGLDSVGKTSLLYRAKLGKVVTTMPTIGFNVETLTYNNVNFTAWDVGGRDKSIKIKWNILHNILCFLIIKNYYLVRPLLRHYYAKTDAVVYMIDSNDMDRIDQSREQIQGMFEEDELEKSVLMVLANKQDIEGCMSVNEIRDLLDLDNIVSGRRFNIFGTDVINGDGINEAFDWLSKCLTGKDGGLIGPLNETIEDVKKISSYSLWSSLKSNIYKFFY